MSGDFLLACAALIFSGIGAIFTYRRTKRTEDQSATIEQGKNELEGRRVSMEEIQLVTDNLTADLARARADMDRQQRRIDEQQRLIDELRADLQADRNKIIERDQTIAQLRRDVVKEQRRSNNLHEDLERVKAQLQRLRSWLTGQNISVPAELNGS